MAATVQSSPPNESRAQVLGATMTISHSPLEPSLGRILIADDEPDFRQSLQMILVQWGYEVQTVSDGQDALQILCDDPPDVALLDWVMPRLSGLEICRRLRAKSHAPFPYLILLSARSRTEDIVAGLDAGADDYVTKPVDFLELRARLQVGFRMIRLQQELGRRATALANSLAEVQALQAVAEESRKREHFLAFHDSLTSLPNRQLFFDRLHQAISQANRSGQFIAVLLLDLDGFKVINDGIGHAAGDQVLQSTGRRLQGCLRDSDTVARLGGDEFAILACGATKTSDIVAIAEKVLHSLSEVFIVESQRCQVGGSIGISLYPSDGHDVETLMKRADFAMYRAKRLGKNRIVLFDPTMDARAQGHASLENDLRSALVQGKFVMHYQPQVNMATGAYTGVEALLRWQRQPTEIVPPEDFIPLAEETGLIIPIGAWALRAACRHHVAWQRTQGPHPRMAVNLSARQFRGVHLVETVAEILEETHFEPCCLELEITESVAMQNLDHSIATMVRLKDMGVRLAVDDFGTGYSSLSYLKRFPIDLLKIDRSFIKGVPKDPDDAAITEAIISLAHSLKLGVIAEGVETREQWEFLRNLDCDEAQGFLLSPPISSDGLCTLLTTGSLASFQPMSKSPYLR
jgi:diguanylate cyclase (GGDEF)-like protein